MSKQSGKKNMSFDSFQLKILAIICMTFNHAAYIYEAELPYLVHLVMVAVGGLTFPIMGFLLVVGYRHTSNLKRYCGRLAIFGAVAIVPFWVFLEPHLNVMFTLLLGLIVIWADDALESRGTFAAVLILAIISSGFCDWAFIGVLTIFLFKRASDKGKSNLLPLGVCSGTMGFSAILAMVAQKSLEYLPSVFFACGNFATLPLLNRYNGQRGRPLKYFFYWYYPLHILALGLLHMALFG